MARHNYLIGHNTSPDRNKPNPSRLTALTPQNQPERPLLRGNQGLVSVEEGWLKVGSEETDRKEIEHLRWVNRIIGAASSSVICTNVELIEKCGDGRRLRQRLALIRGAANSGVELLEKAVR